jgi:diguanylate cyclase (GGDEF)-like protein
LNHTPRSDRPTVLIVQDVGESTDTAITTRRPDLRVLRADNIEDALSILLHNEIDLAIIYQSVGADSGAQVCRLIRQSDMVADVPVLLLSASDDDARLDGLAAGADALIELPVDVAIVDARIDAILRLDRFATRRRMSQRLLELEAQLASLKECDSNTGLPNATMFESSVAQELARAQRAGYALGVLVIEFSNYDKLGSICDQVTLDRLMRAMADRLSGAIRGRAVIGRLDTRCLAICQPLPRAEELTRAVHNYRRVLVDAYDVQGESFDIDCSIGATVFPNDTDEPQRLIGLALSAMAHARQMGRNKYHLLARTASADARRRMQLEGQIRGAIERNDMQLHYQPRLRLSDGAVTSIEALLRLRGEDGELLSPGVFMPVAEDSGMMETLGLWALRQACRDALTLVESGLDVRMAVNIAADLFSKDTFFSELKDTLAETRLDGTHLEIEVSERAVQPQLHGSLSSLQRLLANLQGEGVTLSLDNFGSGLTCLNDLRHLPIDNVKLDQGLIGALPEDARMGRMVDSLVTLCTSLGMHVTAQGVETAEQMICLRAMGCDDAQGYLFARPMPLDSLVHTLHGLVDTWAAAHSSHAVAANA